MLVSDAQLHLGDRLRYRLENTEAGERLSERLLLQVLDDAGVACGVLVPVTSSSDPNTVPLALVHGNPGRFGVMGLVDFEKRSRADVLAWRRQEGMLGIRINFMGDERTAWLRDGSLNWLWESAETASIPIMLFAPRLTHEIGIVADQYPQLRLIVDHLNLGREVRNEEIGPELEPLLKLADRPNIGVKISSLPFYVDEPFPFRSVYPHMARVMDRFGIDRTMWGSDFTKLRCSYEDWLHATFAAIEFLTPPERERFLDGNLSDWLRWPRA